MQFDTPAVLPGILAVDCAVGLFEILEHDRIHILKGIPLHLAAQLDPVTGFEQLIDFLPFILADERLGADRRLVVSDQQRDEIIPAFDDALRLAEQHTLQHDRTQLRCNLPQRRRLPARNAAPHDAVALGRQLLFLAFPAAALSFAAKAAAVASAAEAAACAAVCRLRSFLRPRLEHFPILLHRALDILRLALAERAQAFLQQRLVIFKDNFHVKTKGVLKHLAELLRDLLIELRRCDLAEHRTKKTSVSDADAVFDNCLGNCQI